LSSDVFGVSYLLAGVKLVLPIFILALAIAALITLAVRLLRGRRPSVGTVFGYSFLFALLGGYIGYGTGASREPIVGAIVPALLTLLATAMAYMFSRKQAASTVWQALSIPALTALIISCLVATVVGANARMIAEANIRNTALCEAHYTALRAPVCAAILNKLAVDDTVPSSEAAGNLLVDCQRIMGTPHPCTISLAAPKPADE
jgi:hypothetical protein